MRHAGLICLLLCLSGCENTDTPPKRDPNEWLGSHRFGQSLKQGVAFDRDANLHFIQTLVAGYAPAKQSAPPAKVAPFKQSTSCELAKPTPDELFVQIQISETWQRSGLYMLSNSTVLERAQDYVKQWQRLGARPDVVGAAMPGDSLSVVDVIVTETAKPLHLVLAGGQNILWNIVKDEKARIARVAVLASGYAAIANLDSDVPVESLVGEAAKRCGSVPHREPSPRRNLPGAIPLGRVVIDSELKARQEAFGRYDRWFRQTYAVGSEATVMGMGMASHVLIGPPPTRREGRVPFRSLANSLIQTSASDITIFATSEGKYRTTIEDLVEAHARTLVGGDLAVLDRN